VLPNVEVVPVVDVVPNVDMLPDVVVPSVVVVPKVDMVPSVELLPIGPKVVAGTVNRGLRPPAPSSVAPIGIPTRAEAAAEAIPVGDEADAAGPAKALLPIVKQVPDAVPVMPPPSNAVGDTEVPAVEMPVPDEVPAIELPMPDDAPAVGLPETDDIAAAELARVPMVPNDDCGIEPPKPLHAGLVTVVVDASDVIIGLVPAPPIPVAPRGMRVGGTGAAGPMPSGDVMPSGDGPEGIAPTCAKAPQQLNRTAAVVTITKRVIVVSTDVKFIVRGCGLSSQIRSHARKCFARVAATLPILRRSAQAAADSSLLREAVLDLTLGKTSSCKLTQIRANDRNPGKVISGAAST
jgi:hypothetical protein